MSHAATTKRGDAEKLVVMAAERAKRIGRRVRERRDELELTQAEIADRLDEASVTSTYVSRWERGEHEPQGDRLDKLAAALETTAADLMAGPIAERAEQDDTPDVIGKLNGTVSDDQRLAHIEATVLAIADHLGIELPATEPAGDDAVEELADAPPLPGEQPSPEEDDETDSPGEAPGSQAG